MPSYRLILLSGTGAGTEYPLEKAELYIGRDLSSDVVINDSEVSRRHARLSLKGFSYVLEDLGSTNGTFVNNQRLTAPVVLRPGEAITIGEKVQLKFEVFGLATDATILTSRPAQQTVRREAPIPQPVVVTPPVVSPQPVVTPPIVSHPPVPGYTPIQSTPVIQTGYPVEKKKKGWLVALLIVAGLILVFCIIPALIIEFTDSYCALFPGIFNSLQPGACP